MKRILRTLSVTGIYASLLCVGAALSFADAPSGTISLDVTEPVNAIWDSSTVQELQSPDYGIEEAGVDIRYNAPFEQDAAGKLKGTGPAMVTLESDPQIEMQSATYKVIGSITGKGGVTRVTHTAVAVGTGLIGGAQVKISTTRSVSVIINAVTHEVTGTYKASASASGVGSAKESGLLSASWNEVVPQLGSGAWKLQLTELVTDAKNNIAGNAVVILESGKEFPFLVKGKYNSKTEVSKLTLVPLAEAKGSNLKVLLAGNQIGSFTGKISGQTVLYP